MPDRGLQTKQNPVRCICIMQPFRIVILYVALVPDQHGRSGATISAYSAAAAVQHCRWGLHSPNALCCSMLQYVAVCCSMLQCVAVCCSVLQRVRTSSAMHIRRVGHRTYALLRSPCMLPARPCFLAISIATRIKMVRRNSESCS